jgi:hypothetical protein
VNRTEGKNTLAGWAWHGEELPFFPGWRPRSYAPSCHRYHRPPFKLFALLLRLAAFKFPLQIPGTSSEANDRSLDDATVSGTRTNTSYCVQNTVYEVHPNGANTVRQAAVRRVRLRTKRCRVLPPEPRCGLAGGGHPIASHLQTRAGSGIHLPSCHCPGEEVIVLTNSIRGGSSCGGTPERLQLADPTSCDVATPITSKKPGSSKRPGSGLAKRWDQRRPRIHRGSR